ncbi:hypothetical protein ACVWWO_002148 [Bradyrhizobium sp. F1.13.1]
MGSARFNPIAVRIVTVVVSTVSAIGRGTNGCGSHCCPAVSAIIPSACDRVARTTGELYLCTDSDIWRDPYTHCHAEQLESGTWYVHRPHYSLQREAGTARSRPPRRSGIDIACGSKPRAIHGGLLVRQICKHKGPGTAFTSIVRAGKQFHFQKWSDDDREIIKSIDGKRIDSGDIRLVALPRQRDEAIWVGPRVGFRAREPDPNNLEGISFRSAPLRAATWQMDGRMKVVGD